MRSITNVEWMEADFRVGGYEIYRGNHDGMTVSMESRYFDIVPNERIVRAYDMHFGDDRISVSLTTIELAEGKVTSACPRWTGSRPPA